MNAAELLREWPGWSKANAESVFGSPAWRLRVEYAGGDAGVVRRETIAPLVALDVTFDDDASRLVIGESDEFGDLMRLRERLEGLPGEVVIALVEKECGELLQTVENAVGRQIVIRGVAAAELSGLVAFAVVHAGGETGFALKTDAAMVQRFGAVGNLDAGHATIRALEREASAEYAEIDLLESELSALAVGDRLILPEDAVRAWRTDAGADDLVHVRSAGPSMISFASFADDDLPEVPAPDELALVRRGRVIASAVAGKLGLADAVRITAVG